MKLIKCVFLFYIAALVPISIFAAQENLLPNSGNFAPEKDFGPEDEDDIDPKILRQFIEDQGLIETRNKEGRLTIAGDVRARWMRLTEDLDGVPQRGFNEPPQIATNLFKSEFNLYMDYAAPTSWVETRLKFAVFDGKDGGTLTKVELDRAFLGYELYEDSDEEFFIEAGRNRLDVLFDSKIEFSSYFDGILLTYQNKFEDIGFFNIHGGPMVIDSYTNHYAWILETSLKNLLNTGFSIKYSIVDWMKSGTTLYYGNLKFPLTVPFIVANTPAGFNPQVPHNPRYRFVISQFLVGYEFEPSSYTFCKTSWFYAGGLINHAARRIFSTGFTRQNLGWYIGYTLGRLKKRGDWSVDMNYQFVEIQSIPDFDIAGIGHGNAANVLFSDAILQGLSPFDARGFANYKGFEISGLYALSDSLSLKARFQHSTPVDPDIGGSFDYNNFEFAAIFAF